MRTTYNPEDYSHIIELCRTRWNYSPVIIQKVCLVAERLKKSGFTIEEIRDTDKYVIVEKYLQHPYRNRDYHDRWIGQAIARYQACLKVI